MATEKQRRVVEAYMGEARGNATEAARIAGYKNPEASADKNMSNAARSHESFGDPNRRYALEWRARERQLAKVLRRMEVGWFGGRVG
mgnify:CR=1 FL=1